jgi:hypothetical protein
LVISHSPLLSIGYFEPVGAGLVPGDKPPPEAHREADQAELAM